MAEQSGASASQASSWEPPPPLAALFLIKFDVKVGYTIAWKQSLAGVPLEGVVEYKSLPSGLHNVKHDLVYFVHERWAGVSAFRNAEAEQGERGARFIAVGALVRLGDGRLGRAWEHAGPLTDLAARLVADTGEVRPLEEYWDAHRASGDGDGEVSKEPDSPFTVARRRNRALSSVTLGASGVLQQTLPEHHPAYSILGFLDTFGPLAFALHRMALLRRRILIVTPPPVKAPCEYVYDLSILSSLPHSLSYTPPSEALTRLRPLFNLGIHDIPYLTTLSKPLSNGSSSDAHSEPGYNGFIACTTDEILAMKPELYDVLVELPRPSRSLRTAGPGRKPRNKGAGAQRWPVMRLSGSGDEMKATQRDLRRYRSLRRALSPLTKMESERQSVDMQDEDSEETHLLFNSVHERFDDEGEEELQHRQDEEKVTEKPTWSELAYSSFMWWASAGEREEGLKTEDDQDAALLGNLPDLVRREVERRRYRDDSDDEDTAHHGGERRAEIEMAIIAYFHRLTRTLFEGAEMALQPEVRRAPSQVVAQDEDDDDDDDDEDTVRFESDDLRRCGLDVWSDRDRRFIVAFADLWFGRAVEVRGAGIECCGMRIC
ncbi:uncharacterized protein PV09_04064 [Verruconis gallopava]|uniref:DUF4484 domain-containing protein n=1 Tax=Verruconis gallopava TaxID=253628 RepID=A0A0D2B0L6_9PEZI|nr:uncharacterized protein PV09_04064 [Verruconis gallopava]KIW04889.1 hypothetical protein PV09_04064 [Verruconis gallopava]